MSVPYHAWTHSAGGTDPIDVPSGGLPVGFAQDGLRSQTLSGEMPIDFRFVSWNDDSLFGYAVVSGSSPKRARYLTVNEPGIYWVKSGVSWDTDFTPGDLPYIRTTIYYPSDGSSSNLVNAVGVDSWTDEATAMIYTQQITAEEMDHHQLTSTFVFSTADLDGEASIGIGVSVGSLVSRTKFFGGSIMVARIGEAATQQTIT